MSEGNNGELIAFAAPDAPLGKIEKMMERVRDPGNFTLLGRLISIDRESGVVTTKVPEPGTRQCGDCTLCCKLLPVPEINKPGYTRCQLQSHKGCKVHAMSIMPEACRLFSCRWLADPTTTGLVRPDRSRYVIDMTLDYFPITPEDGGEPVVTPVIQIWVDPAFPRAHEDPKLAVWLAMIGERHNIAAIIRIRPDMATVLVPPAMSPDGTWKTWSGETTARTPSEKKFLDQVEG